MQVELGRGRPGSDGAPSHRLRVTRSLSIPERELTMRADPSGGPGGQHANKASTRVEIRFDVEHSRSLDPDQRARLLERLGPVVRVSAGEERSQARNRQLALERMARKLAGALSNAPVRRETARTAASRERRLASKHHRAETKRRRAGGADADG